jgi:ribosome biogenesis GTPase
MEPIAIGIQPNGEWSLVHRCRRCGMIRMNRIAGDDNEVLLVSMALRPLARPPFPLDRIGGGTVYEEDRP